jgi:hypothetical protein
LNAHGDQKNIGSIRQCLHWGNGVVLLGRAFRWGIPGAGWLVRLDGSGKFEWETTDDEASSGDDAIEMPDGRLAMSAWTPQTRLVMLRQGVLTWITLK